MGNETGKIYSSTLWRFLGISVVCMLFPGTLNYEQPDPTTFVLLPSSNAPDLLMQKSDSTFLNPYTDTPVPVTKPKDVVQGSSSYVSLPSKNSESTTPQAVTMQLQAENLLDQGYTVKDISQELQLSRKEVRKLKRQIKKEQKAAVQQRKKEQKKKENALSQKN